MTNKELKHLKIAFLGPAGTYSHIAAQKFSNLIQGEEADEQIDFQFIECATFDEVFEFVDTGRVSAGVVPIENSIEGAVTSTLDNFAHTSNAQILAEVVLDIHHCLVAHSEAKLADITQISSHAQGIAQCRRYINAKFPGVSLHTTHSTAQSAKQAANDIHTAGIANKLAASLANVRVVAENIEDNFGNQTKFALIARPNSPLATCFSNGQVACQDAYKTSLALFLQADKVGALLMILEEFAYANVNLSMLQSRPTKQALGDYMFFVDLEGKITEPNIQTALSCLRLKLREVKVLGCYPVW